MTITRAQMLRGLAAGASLIPAQALARPTLREAEGFRADLSAGGAHPWNRPPAGGQGSLRFAVIGDRTGLARPGVFEQGILQASWLQPDFILSVGDLIEGYTQDRTEIARQWSDVRGAIARTGLPFICAQGNHDVSNAETLDAWRENWGPGYYSFTYKGALFIVLNTEETPTPISESLSRYFYSLVDKMQKDPEATQKAIAERVSLNSGRASEFQGVEVVKFGERQLGFLRDTLARHPHPHWTFVIMHKPAWKMQNPAFAQMQALLRGRPYTVFAGHTHYFTHEVIDGADYINMGTTGGIHNLSTENGAPLRLGAGTMDHTMMVTLTEHGPIYANQRLTGLMDVAGHTGQIRAY